MTIMLECFQRLANQTRMLHDLGQNLAGRPAHDLIDLGSQQAVRAGRGRELVGGPPKGEPMKRLPNGAVVL